MIIRPKFSTLAAASAVLASMLTVSACETLDQFITPGTKVDIRGERISVLPKAAQVEADAKLAGQPVVLPKPSINADWPQPGGYADNAMHHLSASGKLDEQWNSGIGSGSSSSTRLTASPVVADGKIFVLDSEVQVSAYNSKTGERIWEINLTPKDEDSEEGFGGGVAYDGGRLFVSTGFGFVSALDAKTEHTDRGALEILLNAAAADADIRLRVQHEPKRDKGGGGSPDYMIKRDARIVGYAEVKFTLFCIQGQIQ